MSEQIWFTSDTHFGHKNVIPHCNRPFASIEEHDETLIENWNNKVAKHDRVFHLGDFSLCNKEKALEILKRLNGQIHLCLGNHDNLNKNMEEMFVWVKNYHELKVKHLPCQKIVLSHYAHRVWNRSHYGSYHLFGHSHGDLEDYGLSTDVGVDRWAYAPVSIEEICQYMEAKPKQSGDFDHHGFDR